MVLSMVSLALEAGTETATAVFAITWDLPAAAGHCQLFFCLKLHPKPRSPIVFIYQKYHLLRKEKFLFQDSKQK